MATTIIKDYMKAIISTKIKIFLSLDRLTFGALLLSGAFTLLLWSPNVLGRRLDSFSKLLIFLAPWMLLWPVFSLKVIRERSYRIEIILIITVIVLGFLNVRFSDNSSRTYKEMQVFLADGVMVLWPAMFLLADQARRKIFDWFCCGCLAIIATTEIVIYLARGVGNPKSIDIFALHAIPIGTIMILLSPGPVRLLFAENLKMRIASGALLSLGSALILLTQKRGTFLAVAVILLISVCYRRTKLGYLVIPLLLTVAVLVPFKGIKRYATLNPEIEAHFSILHRLELYPFAMHIFKSHPLLGIGLRPFTHERYLKDYQQHNQNLGDFTITVKQLQTFDNMLVTGFIELGTLLTLAYLALIGYIFIKYLQKLRSLSGAHPADWYRVLALIGFMIHSLTYDSLLFPPVSWLFHVQLGTLSCFTPLIERTSQYRSGNASANKL